MYGGMTGSVLLSKDNVEDLKSIDIMNYIFGCWNSDGLDFIEHGMEGFSREFKFDDKVNLSFATGTKAYRLIEILEIIFRVAEAYLIYYADEYGRKSVFYKDTEDGCYIFNSMKLISYWVEDFDYSNTAKNQYVIKEDDWRSYL